MRDRAGGKESETRDRKSWRVARERKTERERESERTSGRRAGRGYGKPWQLAKSLGSAPGENYSRYEFTVGAGLRRAKEEWRNGGNGMGMKGARDGAADSGRVLEAR